MTIKQTCDIIEEAVAILRTNRERILELAPCQIAVHFPPPDSGERVALDIVKAKLK